jgi:glutamyl-tRNA reductase
MPRDIEPKAADCDNVFLYVLEDLAQIVRENQHARENEIKSLREELSKRAYNLWKSFAAWNGLQ